MNTLVCQIVNLYDENASEDLYCNSIMDFADSILSEPCYDTLDEYDLIEHKEFLMQVLNRYGFIKWIDEDKLIFKIDKAKSDMFLNEHAKKIKKLANKISGEIPMEDLNPIIDIRSVIRSAYELQVVGYFDHTISIIDWLYSNRENIVKENKFQILNVGSLGY